MQDIKIKFEEALEGLDKFLLYSDFTSEEENYKELMRKIRISRSYLSTLQEEESEGLCDREEEIEFAVDCLKYMCKKIPSDKTEDFHHRVFTISEASEELNVSTKTVSRWRSQGLESFKTLGSDGRLRVGILESDLKDFKMLHSAKAEKGYSFSQLQGAEKINILIKAKRDIEDGLCPADATKNVADCFQRSVETVRYIIKEHDMLNPTDKIFHKITDPLSEQERHHVFEMWLSGRSEAELSGDFCRSKSLIRDIIVEKRLNRIACSISPLREVSQHDDTDSFCLLPEDFVWSKEFEDMEEGDILKDVEISEDAPRRRIKEIGKDVSGSMDFYIKSLYMNDMISNENTMHLFRKMNYLKWKIHNNLKDICAAEYVKVSNKDLLTLESLAESAKDVKNIIVKSNLRLVVSIARKHSETEELFSLISDGNISLMRAVDKFDFTMGTRFSTYATAAISKNYSRTIPKELKTREKFKPTCDEVFQLQEDTRANLIEVDANLEHVNKAVESLTSILDKREMEIVTLRFGLDYSKEPMTLKEVGAEVGLTKERVRQIAELAIEKMRRVGTALELYDF